MLTITMTMGPEVLAALASEAEARVQAYADRIATLPVGVLRALLDDDLEDWERVAIERELVARGGAS